MKVNLTFLTLFLLFRAFSQNEASTLYFGKTLLDFRYDPPQVLSTHANDPRECAASICDEQGNLLFYSNGGVSPTGPWAGGVFGPDNQLLQNGSSVDSGGCVSSFQGAIILPDPAGISPGNRRYFLFTKDCLESSFSTIHYNSGLTYSIIDMNANGGAGAVISKYNSLVPYHVIQAHKTSYEPVTAVLDVEGGQKSGGTGYWLFSYTDDSLYHLHFGINGFDQFRKLVGGQGALVVSPDRLHMCVGNVLYRLDPVLGTVEYRETLPSDAKTAFSPDGSKLYVITGTNLKQYDLGQSDVLNTVQMIATVPSESTLFLTPAKRIWVYQPSVGFIDGSIVCANNSGLSCGWDPTNISLNGGVTQYSGRPNIPAHFLYGTYANCSLSIQNAEQPDLSLFPNPGNEFVRVFGLNKEFDYDVYGSDGKHLKKGSGNAQEPISIVELASGVYFLQLENQVLPFVKQ